MFTLAHYSGLDEVGLFVLPALLAILVLRWVEQRARKRSRDEDRETSGVD